MTPTAQTYWKLLHLACIVNFYSPLLYPPTNSHTSYLSSIHLPPSQPVLPDLPLPSHLPTSLESSILYPTPLRDDTKKILNTASTAVSQRIAAALGKVNLDFL